MKNLATLGLTLAAGAGAAALPAAAAATTIDFNDLVHGEVVDTQYQSRYGLTISATNPNRGFDLAAAFDSNRSGTRDPDLEGPFTGGNLPGNTDLGNLLIIAENNRDKNHDGILDKPDDEGRRPGGSIAFDFGRNVTSFGFTLVDIEGRPEFPGGYFLALFDGVNELARIDFKDFVERDPIDAVAQAVYDGYTDATRPVFGDNSINAIAPITASQVGGSFDRVVIGLGGSGAVGEVEFTAAPTPTAVASGLVLLAGTMLRRRRA